MQSHELSSFVGRVPLLCVPGRSRYRFAILRRLLASELSPEFLQGSHHQPNRQSPRNQPMPQAALDAAGEPSCSAVLERDLTCASIIAACSRYFSPLLNGGAESRVRGRHPYDLVPRQQLLCRRQVERQGRTQSFASAPGVLRDGLIRPRAQRKFAWHPCAHPRITPCSILVWPTLRTSEPVSPLRRRNQWKRQGWQRHSASSSRCCFPRANSLLPRSALR